MADGRQSVTPSEARGLVASSAAILCDMGLPLLDNANFDALAAVCAELNRWEFLLIIAPLVVLGGTGSPVNPIAVV